MAGMPWRLEIADDGSAEVQYHAWPVDEKSKVGEGFSNFEALLDRLSQLVSEDGHYDRNPTLFLHRRGQGMTQGQPLNGTELVASLFKRAIEQSVPPNPALERLIRERWPY